MIAAVRPLILCVLVVYRMIRPFPNTTAHELVGRIEQLHILIKTAGTYAHSVSVLALEERFSYVFISRSVAENVLHSRLFIADITHKIGSCIHVRYDVVSPPFAPVYALVMDGYFAVELFEIVVTNVLTLISARLVTERPHCYRRMILIPSEHSLNSVEIMIRPLHIVTEPIGIIRRMRYSVKAVRLYIRLVYDVESVDVAHSKEYGIGRIMRRTHGVDVIFLHEFYVFFEIVHRHNVTVYRVRIVMVNALHLDLSAVEKEYFAVYFNMFESYYLTNTLERRTVLFFERHYRLIYVGSLCGPFLRRYVARYHRAVGLEFVLSLNAVAYELESYPNVSRESAVYACDERIVAVADEFRTQEYIVYIALLVRSDIYVSEYSVLSEHILTLEIRAVTPLKNDGDELVLTVVHVVGYVELRGIVTAFAVAYVLSVDV